MTWGLEFGLFSPSSKVQKAILGNGIVPPAKEILARRIYVAMMDPRHKKYTHPMTGQETDISRALPATWGVNNNRYVTTHTFM